jgi:3-oxoacyl-[acyl-carrier protein] reductase
MIVVPSSGPSSTNGYGIQGRVAIITGGAQGIGRVLSIAFAAEGANVVVADVNVKRARETADTIMAAGGKATSIEVDVGHSDSVNGMVREAMAACGRIDILVNNAALFSSLEVKPFEDISLQEWNEVMTINVTGVFLCCQAVSAAMRAARFGRIINMSSAAQRMGRPNYLHYIASKGAVEAMSRSLARELGPSGITVNSILPGAIETEIPRATVTSDQKMRIVASQCVPRGGTPADIISTALHLASASSGFVTGQSFIVDGGVVHGG